MNRREMLRLGAAGAGGLLLSSAASSQGLGPSILTQPMVPIAPVTRVPAAPVTPLAIDSSLFERAKASLDAHRIAARDSIGIVDFSMASRDPRFHLVDLAGGTVESFRVAHGRGSDPDHSGFVERFSNQPGSEATSNGTYTTGDYYHGKYGLSMKVDGLDWTNSNAASRAIVIHNAWYAEPEMIDVHGKLGRSEGCFAFSRADQWRVMSKLAGGRMIFAEKLIA
ncbi:murein L,D-transpeptidase catalytic domain family protein [Sphingomonas sp.]|uniref:murein L,D-transpeptidase catalytic domain family protein n=1 Tax=Sphingomonas sp. TaxID=28214 RepID=UPI0025DDAA57|nr:murein L,D-transpeptidase catalytic domain family protein [Sphingomonas sp.]